jgi:hypothetical protein
LEEKIKTIKNYNIILKNTILKLKSPEYMEKYVKVGRDMAQREQIASSEIQLKVGARSITGVDSNTGN